MKVNGLILSLIAIVFLAIVSTGCETVNPIPTVPPNNSPIKVLDASNFGTTVREGYTLAFFTSQTCQECADLELLIETTAVSEDWSIDDLIVN